MSAHRSRKEEKIYVHYLKSLPKDMCVFCASHRQELIQDSPSFKVIRNIYPYSIWDGQRVVDHLLLVPKLHTPTLADVSNKQCKEMHDILADYEQRGYNIYARAPSSVIKSITHQHTHLIRTEGAPKKFILLNRKPYVRFAS